jgi:hypothetical protein
MMRSQTRLLSGVLFFVAAIAVWTETGLSVSRSGPAQVIFSGSVPCPPGFVPPSQSMLLPEVPPGQFRPARRRVPELRCVVLAAPPIR